jgi:ubiquinone/menaquinone biosynthesis C-methylase UbiE
MFDYSKRVKSLMKGEYEKVWKKLLEIADEKAYRFLDIGFSNGKLTIKFARRIDAKEIYGIDINKSNLKKAKRRGVKVIYADANGKLPFPSNFFDLVLCNQVAEHLLNPDNLFKEIHRILKTNGVAYISVPNLCSFHNRVFVLFGWQPTTIPPSTKFVFGNPLRNQKVKFEGGKHINAFSPAALIEMLEFYGLKVEKYVGSGFYPFSGKIADVLSNIFPKLSVYQIVKVRKLD